MKYGRKPRRFDSRVPHFGALRFAVPTLPVAPPSISYTQGIPAIGMFGNNLWGCCAEAAVAHLIQLWIWNATGTMPQITTDQVLQFYSEITGFDQNAGPPDSNPTDQGSVLQDVLAYWLKVGFPMADGTRHKILAYFEVDPRNAADLNLGTAESAGLYLGFNVPAWLEQAEAPGTTWGDPPAGADTKIVGGHCVVSGGYGADGKREIESWGSPEYGMTPSFFGTQVDECYVVVSNDFQKNTGRTPYGIPVSVWEAQMQAIKEAA